MRELGLTKLRRVWQSLPTPLRIARGGSTTSVATMRMSRRPIALGRLWTPFAARPTRPARSILPFTLIRENDGRRGGKTNFRPKPLLQRGSVEKHSFSAGCASFPRIRVTEKSRSQPGRGPPCVGESDTGNRNPFE